MDKVQPPLRLEIVKSFDVTVIRFLVDGMRSFPAIFARERKTAFIHQEAYTSMTSGSSYGRRMMEEVYSLVNVYDNKGLQASQLMHDLRLKSVEIYRRACVASSFEELLLCVQCLILTHCIIFFDDNQGYSESASAMLTSLAWRLWQQAPIHLPRILSPRKAWLFAESVRRTIIVAYMLCSVYSFGKRHFSVRTPFVEALPFDVRAFLWDREDWEDQDLQQQTDTRAMVSLREYSTMLETGHKDGISFFGSLILAACKGIPASRIELPMAS